MTDIKKILDEIDGLREKAEEDINSGGGREVIKHYDPTRSPSIPLVA